MRKVILVVEDEAEIRKDLVMTLKFSNYEALGAENGRVGLELAKKHHPDLIISDIMMPEVDGYQFLNLIQKDPDIGTTPFLFLSAKSDIREGMNLGADDFITKPYDIDELLNAIDTRLKKREASETKFLRKFEELSTSISRSLPHEIRTPLGMILGYSDFLIKNFDATNPYEAKEMLENIYESGRRLNRLFENHLFYAQLETIASNKVKAKKLSKNRTAPADIFLQDIIDYFASSTGRRADIFTDLDDGAILVSEKYLVKIIEEILDNAIKFSKKGTRIEISSKMAGNNKYIISFKDYGRGMTLQQIKNVGAYIQFERQIYEQQGSGLGIAIVKKIVELHEGEFAIDSDPDNYTIVKIILPAEKNTEKKEAKES